MMGGTGQSDREASWLLGGSLLYVLIGVHQPGLASPHIALLSMAVILVIVLDHLSLDSVFVTIVRKWSPRDGCGQGTYASLLVPFCVLLSESNPDKGIGGVYLLCLGVLVQALTVHFNSTRIMTRTKRTSVACAFSELLSGIVFVIMLKGPLRISVTNAGLLLILASVVMVYGCQTGLLTCLPRTFSLGEATLVAQGLVFIFAVPHIQGCSTDQDPEGLSEILCFLQVAGVCALLVVCVTCGVPYFDCSAGFYSVCAFVCSGLALPLLTHLLHTNFLIWIYQLVAATHITVGLVVYWCACSVIAILLVFLNSSHIAVQHRRTVARRRSAETSRPLKKTQDLEPKAAKHKERQRIDTTHAHTHSRQKLSQISSDSSKEKINTDGVPTENGVKPSVINIRKQFHILAILVFLPGLTLDTKLLLVASTCAVIIFVLLEVVRKCRVWPLGELLSMYMRVLTDSRDSGPVIVTHLYLLIGCSLPLWLKPAHSHTGIAVCHLSGVLSLGIGDTFASVVGTKIGTHRWPGSGKTIEGTIASCIAQFVFLFMLYLSGVMAPFSWSVVAIAIVLSSLLEALTSQIDNLLLPLAMFALMPKT